MTPIELSIHYLYQTCIDTIPLFIALGITFAGALIHRVFNENYYIIPQEGVGDDNKK